MPKAAMSSGREWPPQFVFETPMKSIDDAFGRARERWKAKSGLPVATLGSPPDVVMTGYSPLVPTQAEPNSALPDGMP